MNKKIIILLGIVSLLVVGSVILAAPSGGFTINWWTADGGGGTSSGGSFAVSGTVGQPDAAVSTGGLYVLTGGFWNDQVQGISGGETEKVYLPIGIKP